MTDHLAVLDRMLSPGQDGWLMDDERQAITAAIALMRGQSEECANDAKRLDWLDKRSLWQFRGDYSLTLREALDEAMQQERDDA